jgi:hypothetical protein
MIRHFREIVFRNRERKVVAEIDAPLVAEQARLAQIEIAKANSIQSKKRAKEVSEVALEAAESGCPSLYVSEFCKFFNWLTSDSEMIGILENKGFEIKEDRNVRGNGYFEVKWD